MNSFMGKFWNFWFLYVINLSATGYNSMYILVHMYSFMALLYTEVHIYTATLLYSVCIPVYRDKDSWLASSVSNRDRTRYVVQYCPPYDYAIGWVDLALFRMLCICRLFTFPQVQYDSYEDIRFFGGPKNNISITENSKKMNQKNKLIWNFFNFPTKIWSGSQHFFLIIKFQFYLVCLI